MRTNYHHSQETKEKMRLSNLGQKRSPEAREKMRLAHLGRKNKPHSEATKLKMSLASKGKPKSKEHRKALSIARTGIPHGHKTCNGLHSWNWISDRTKVKVGERSLNDPLQKGWRKAVKDSDGWKCKIADENCDGRLEAHHILPWSEFPELRYSVNNGITLCHAHHPRKKADVAKLSPYFQSLVASRG